MENLKEPYNLKKILSITGALVGFISAVLTIYIFFFSGNKINLNIEVLSNTNVLDINANLSKLDIIYNGENLKSSKQNLRILNIKISNDGNESILKGYYDLNDPIGIMVSGSKIVEIPELINASNSYIKKNIKINVSNGSVTFNDLILEPNQSFTIKLLVLHNSTITPKVIPLGKIAGQNEIPVITTLPSKDKSIWSDAFAATIEIQVSRIIGYGIIFIVVLILLIISMIGISEFWKKKKRKKIVKGFKKLPDYQPNKMDEAIFIRFENQDVMLLERFLSYLTDEKKLNSIYKENLEEINKVAGKSQDSVMRYDIATKGTTGSYEEWSDINQMITDGLVIKKDEKLLINYPMKNTLSRFTKHLKEIQYNINRYEELIMSEPGE